MRIGLLHFTGGGVVQKYGFRTASTGMNSQSSRSHAIFTIGMVVRSERVGAGRVLELNLLLITIINHERLVLVDSIENESSI